MARSNVPKKHIRFPVNSKNRNEIFNKLAEHDTALDALELPLIVANATAGGTVANTPSGDVWFVIDIPDAATTTYVYKTSKKFEITDVHLIKQGAGAGNTIQLTDASDVAISNAMAAAVDATITRAGTIDVTKTTVAAGGTFKVVATRSAGTMAAKVFVKGVLRA